MPVVRAQVVLPFRTNLPSDVMTNTFHFGVDDALGMIPATVDLIPALTAFYLDAYDLGMAAYVNLPACHINFYDLSTPEPRIPYVDTTIGAQFGTNMTTGTTAPPTEVAAVLSFEATPVAGGNQARRRGRVYLGGLTTAMLTAASSTAPFFPIFNTNFLTDVIDSAETNLLSLNASSSGDIQWAVYSATEDVAYIVQQGWVDNSPDTQRRRGVLATARTLWP